MALAALCVVAPIAVAHEGNPNYSSEVREIAPALPGLDARVLNYDDRIELVYDGGRPLVVDGYREEPYLNEDRFAQVEVPARADHEAPPAWEPVAENGRYDWHDHRIHWMGKGTLPPQIEDEAEPAKVFDWAIPMATAGRPAAVRGTLRWLGEESGGFPLAAALSLGGALIAGVLLVVAVRRRRRAGAAAKEAW
ncbi:MAG: hypothetical protein ACRDL4_19465 [Thermoleophilaceae bacterium]